MNPEAMKTTTEGAEAKNVVGSSPIIFRLNRLWERSDLMALEKNYDGWNRTLDNIYQELSYEGEMKTFVDKKTGKISSIRLVQDDDHIAKYFKDTLSEFYTKLNYIKKMPTETGEVTETGEPITISYIPEANVIMTQIGRILTEKSKWLRNKMNKKNLYVKNITDPKISSRFEDDREDEE